MFTATISFINFLPHFFVYQGSNLFYHQAVLFLAASCGSQQKCLILRWYFLWDIGNFPDHKTSLQPDKIVISTRDQDKTESSLWSAPSLDRDETENFANHCLSQFLHTKDFAVHLISYCFRFSSILECNTAMPCPCSVAVYISGLGAKPTQIDNVK